MSEKIALNFQLADKTIDGATIKPLLFQTYSDYVNEVNMMTEPAAWEAKMRRVRLARQVNYQVNGTTVPVTMTEVLRMRPPDALKLIFRLDNYEGKAGKVIKQGDGIDKSIVYELGTPIPAGKEFIKELEFLAATYGEIEDVLASANQIQMGSKLIATVAKPLGTTLLVLPSAAAAQITMADGMTIVNEVLPHFIKSADE